MRDTRTPGIDARSLTKSFHPERPPAVDQLTFQVAAGEVYGLLGANGSGKSTTVGMLTTLLAPSAGTAVVAGFDLREHPAAVRARIGVTLQEAGVDPAATPRDLLTLHGTLIGLTRTDLRRRVSDLLDTLDLTDNADRRVRTLSGGNRRRVDLALALLDAPDVVFLDEPTTGLDPRSRQVIWEQVRRLRDHGTAVLLTTQYLEEADRLADRVGILTAGRLRAEGTPEALKQRVGGDVLTIDIDPGDQPAALHLPGARRDGPTRILLTVDDGGAAVPRTLDQLTRMGIAARSVAFTRPTLDDVFLQLTDTRLTDTTPTDNPAAAADQRRPGHSRKVPI